MIHFFIVLCIWDLPERHNFARLFFFLAKKKYNFFLLLHILCSYRNSIFTCGVFLFVITFCSLLLFFFFALGPSGLSFHSASSKYGSLHPKHKLKLLKAFLIDVFFELPVKIAQTQDSIFLHRTINLKLFRSLTLSCLLLKT